MPNRSTLKMIFTFGAIFLLAYFLSNEFFSHSSSPFNSLSLAPESLDRQVEAAFVAQPRLREIFALVGTNPNQPTKRVHDEFWNLLLKEVPAKPSELQSTLMKALGGGQPFEQAFWGSMRQSAVSHKVVISKDLEDWDNSLPKAKFTENERSRQYAMLSAAAEGRPYVAIDGKTTIFSEKAIEADQNYINSEIIRQSRLFDPNW